MQEVLKYVDDLVFAQTGKHLDSLQLAILKGVFNGQKYTEIAKEYNCTPGHTKDEAYELWQLLSETLGEDLNKSNVRAAVERLGFSNSQYQIIGNPLQIGNIQLCSNSGQKSEVSETEDDELVGSDSINALEVLQRKAKLETVPELAKLGLTVEQIAQALNLPADEVEQEMKRSKN